MACVTKELTKKVRENLKKQFPQFKFSVRNENHSSLNVTIKSGNVDFSDIFNDDKNYKSLNHFHLNMYGKHQEILEEILKVINVDNWDKSDIQSDYFNIGYHVDFNVGFWDKGYVYKGETNEKPQKTH